MKFLVEARSTIVGMWWSNLFVLSIWVFPRLLYKILYFISLLCNNIWLYNVKPNVTSPTPYSQRPKILLDAIYPSHFCVLFLFAVLDRFGITLMELCCRHLLSSCIVPHVMRSILRSSERSNCSSLFFFVQDSHP